MKIRLGFVSNSSSSSFLIYGACFEQDELAKIFKLEKAEEEDFDFDEISEKVEKAGLEFQYGPEGESLYIGRSWSSVGDNETGKQFKDSIKEKVEELCDKKIKCDTYEEAWYNG